MSKTTQATAATTNAAAVDKAKALKAALEKSKAQTAAIQTPAATPSASNADLKGAYKAVFDQQTAQVNRQNALRSGSATRTAQEQAALSGFAQGSDQSQRLMERSQASANAANLESQQNLLSTGSDLAKRADLRARIEKEAEKAFEGFGK